MFRCICLLIFIGSSIGWLAAQSRLTGRVTDKKGTPLEGCSVWLLQSDTLVGGGVSDKKGNFVFDGLREAEYECRISMIGFREAKQIFTLKGSKMRLPDFALEENVEQLDEVTVDGDVRNIITRKAGTTIFHLSERAKKAGNAFEALQEIPKLTVNPIHRTITLSSGKTPLILINGVKRPGYIQTLNPEIIESVEVIETPSARYLGDEEVTAVLNIRIKREQLPRYVNGNLFTRHAVAPPGYGVSGLNLETGNAQSSLYLTSQHVYLSGDKTETYQQSWSGDVWQEMSGERFYTGHTYSFTLGGDRIFSDKDYMAFSLGYNGTTGDSQANQRGTIGYLSTNQQSDASGSQQTDSRSNQAVGYLYYKHTFGKKQTLELTGNYVYSSVASSGKQEDRNDFWQYTDLIDFDNHRHYGMLNADYMQVLRNKFNLSAGSRTTYSATYIDDRNDAFPVYPYKRWQEYLYAGFDNNRSKGKFHYALSLGLDMLFSEADGIHHHYVTALPSASLSYQLKRGHTLGLSYRRSRTNPTAEQLNPRNMSTDSLYIWRGNPYLTPEVKDNVQLSYSLNYKKLYLEPYVSYSRLSDLISQEGVAQGNIRENTYYNYQHADLLKAGATIGYNLPFGNVNVMAFYQKQYQKEYVYSGETWWVSFNGYFYYKNVSLSLNANYASAYYSVDSRVESFPYSSAMFSWQLPKGWQLNVMGEYLLRYKVPTKNWSRGENYYTYSTSRMVDRTPALMVGFSYSFKNKVSTKWRQKKRFYNSDNELRGIDIK